MAKDNAISGDFLLVTKQMKNVGRAYKKQSTEFIKLCRAVDAHPRSHDRDGGFHEIMELVDDALQKIALAGKNPTPAADAALETAKEKMKVYMEGVGIDTAALEGLNRAQAADKSSAGKFAKLKEKMGVAPGTGLRRGSTKKLNFHLLNSPHERDQTVFIVHQELDVPVELSMILWNFSRYNDDRRITLKQNPHFYDRLPDSAAHYRSDYRRQPLKDFGSNLEHNSQIYVLVDRPRCRLYLEVPTIRRTFGNLWMPHETIILKDSEGILEAEHVVSSKLRNMSLRFWHRAASNHQAELQIINTPLQHWSALIRVALEHPELELLVRTEGPKTERLKGWTPFPIPHPRPGPTSQSARSPDTPYGASSATTISTATSHVSSSSLATTVDASEVPRIVVRPPPATSRPRQPPAPLRPVPSVANDDIVHAQLTPQSARVDNSPRASASSRAPSPSLSSPGETRSPQTAEGASTTRPPARPSIVPVSPGKSSPARSSGSSWFQSVREIWETITRDVAERSDTP